jgi:hypothetical protein
MRLRTLPGENLKKAWEKQSKRAYAILYLMIDPRQRHISVLTGSVAWALLENEFENDIGFNRANTHLIPLMLFSMSLNTYCSSA